MVFASVVQQHLGAAQEHRSEKKLDLNAPLMSVRRHGILSLETATASSSEDEQHNSNNQIAYQNRWASPRSDPCGDNHAKAEMEGAQDEGAASWGSLRSPGAVPFVWERTPGKPKFQSSSNKIFPPDDACSSPSLPPGRRSTTCNWATPAATASDPDNPPLRPVADVKAQQQQFMKKKKLPLLLKESPHRKHKQSSLAELFKKKGIPSTCSSEERNDDDDDADVFSDVQQQSENLSAMDPLVRSDTTKNKNPCWDDPTARDFILRRFLPAAKAMADESASSTPFSSPLISPSPNTQLANPRTTTLSSSISNPSSTSSPRKQVSANVERIQNYQYKFANGNSDKSRDEDFFALKACGFFSWNFAAALRHLRPHYGTGTSSRMKRSSDRAHNRFASDDFHTSIVVRKVNGGLTIRHEGEFSETETEDERKSHSNHQHPRRKDWKKNQVNYANSLLKSPRRLLSSPKNQETFYDCSTSFSSQPQASPQRVKGGLNSGFGYYYRGSMSPLPDKNSDSRGFLGLPENYKPPEDSYRSGGYSPLVQATQQKAFSELDKERNKFLAERLGKNLWLNVDNSNIDSSPNRGTGNGDPSWSGNKSASFVANGTRKEVENGRGWPTLTTQVHPSDLPRTSAAETASPTASSPTAGLLPPKSPSQSWLWKTLPLSPSMTSQEINAKWENTVKSRQLRPGHLRYSEENALQTCEY